MISYSWESLQCLKLSSSRQIHRTDHLKGQEYLKGLSLVPSSEGFTMTAFLPAYLGEIRCWNGQEISVILSHNVINHRAAGSLKELYLPESSRTTLPPFMIFPMTTSERNSIFEVRFQPPRWFQRNSIKNFRRVGVGQDHIYLPFFDLIFLR